YTAAFPLGMRWNPQLIALYKRLIAKGKPHKVALVACARKLLIFVNTVVERETPWTKEETMARFNGCYFRTPFSCNAAPISSRTTGSSMVAGMAQGSPSAIFFIVPRRIFPARVFGRRATAIASLN